MFFVQEYYLEFYIQSICLFATGLIMCGLQFQHILFGLVSGGCFFIRVEAIDVTESER